MDGGGGGDTEQKGSFFVGWVFCIFSSSRRFLPRHAKQHKNVYDIFPFLFSKRRTSRQVSGRKNAHDDETTTHKNKTINRHTNLTFYYASYTHNVYRAIRIYDCGKYTFRGIRFTRRSMDARFARVRIERWSERDCRSRGKKSA